MIGIDILPDDVLLEIFDFYLDSPQQDDKWRTSAWQSLVHVCRRWRNIVFGSPRRLDLQLYCTPLTRSKDRLDVWPAFPLIVVGLVLSPSGTDNIIAALGRSNRVCEVILHLMSWQSEKILAPMQVSFPELTALCLLSDDETPPVIPDSFLGGSAPRLQTLQLTSILFPGLPKLLLSATQLVKLSLINIPYSGYISPKSMATLLSILSNLVKLSLEFRSPQSRPDWESQSLPPPKRFILSALNYFRFKGVTEYLEELVTHIDAPQLHQMLLTFFNQIDFDCPRIAQFIDCTPTLKAVDEVHVHFYNSAASITLQSSTSISRFNSVINISCREPDWQLSSIEQICNHSLHPPLTVEDLYINHEYSKLVWKDDAIENTLWMQLLRPFTAVKNLYISKEFAPGIAAALQDLAGGRITEVLPSLQNILVEGLKPSGPVQGYIGRFIAARQLRVSNHPIAISVWDKDIDRSGDTYSDESDLESR